MNIWAGVIIGLAALGYAGYKYSQVKSEVESIDFDIQARIHKLGFTSVVFAIDAIIKNPSQYKVHILYPYIEIFHMEKEVASSGVSDRIITIEPFAPVPMPVIKITASYLNMSSLASEMIKKLSDPKKKITVKMKAHVKILVGLSGEIPEHLKDYKGKAKKIIPVTITKDFNF